MRKEGNYNDQSAENSTTGIETQSAFQYLKSLPSNIGRPAVDSYRRGRTTAIIDSEVAETFTDNFRGVSAPFFIPVSWSMTKSALINLLGITDYDGHEAVNGIRFYAGLNGDDQLTLIAVSTKAGTGCDDDLTEEDEYPYYDYADPCPDSCSSIGNLKMATPMQTKVAVVIE